MKFWKIAFWVWALLFLIQLITIPFSASSNIWDLVGLVAGGISLVPLYGYAYQIAIGSRLIAMVIFSFNALIMLGGLVSIAPMTIEYWSLFQFFMTLIVLGISFAFIYPQYRYAFKSNNLWAGGV